MTASSGLFVGGRRLRLDDRDLLGEGGEGRVYRDGDRAVKVFTVPDAARAKKLRSFPTHLPGSVIAPLDLVTNATGNVVGFSMRALDHAVDLHRFAQRRWREGRVSNDSMLGIFRDLGAAVETLHARGVVVGDLNDGNVVVTPPTATTVSWSPWLIDADSMQFGAHLCVVAHERFLDPRLYGVDLARGTTNLSRESDWYALAVLAFGSLLYLHPFGGSHPSYPTLLRRAEARCSALRRDVKLPNAAVKPDILPDDALAWFERVFEHDLREPLPLPLLQARFVRCTCGVEHARVSCPICTTRVQVAPAVRARGALRATTVVSARGGRIVAAAFQGALKCAIERDGALVREDGSLVLALDETSDLALAYARDPNRIVRLAGNATWIGAGGRMSKVMAARVLESIPIGLARGEIAADAGPEGVVHVQGDTLVRAEEATRIGLILEGQTFVRIGTTLGFAFYRAGELTVAFVFDRRRGGLRQIERFPRIEGKLLGWSAVFDESHVLVTLATDDRGRVRHTAHLVDARAELVATDDGTAFPASLAGRALAGGSVLVASDDGLVLLRPDRTTGRFVAVKQFDDARDCVSPETDLLVGPAGSVFVVGHDEITHLTFTD
jgi:hypothetical protein